MEAVSRQHSIPAVAWLLLTLGRFTVRLRNKRQRGCIWNKDPLCRTSGMPPQRSHNPRVESYTSEDHDLIAWPKMGVLFRGWNFPRWGFAGGSQSLAAAPPCLTTSCVSASWATVIVTELLYLAAVYHYYQLLWYIEISERTSKVSFSALTCLCQEIASQWERKKKKPKAAATFSKEFQVSLYIWSRDPFWINMVA